jgi:HD superfamily phosphodiesterase
VNREKLIEIGREAMAGRAVHAGREAGFTFHHGRRVGGVAVSLWERLGRPSEVDPDIVYAAGLFHDLGKGEPVHNEAGAEEVRRLLAEVCEPHEVSEIALLVARHTERGREGLSLAARIVQDADVLDHFGGQLIWKLFVYSARHDRSPWAALQYYWCDEHQDWIDGARAGLNLDVSREAFESRRRVETAFLERFRAELDGAL